MRLIPRVSLRSVLRAAPACSSGAVFSEQERMEQWNSREGVGNRDAIRLLGILSSGLLSIRIASLFPSPIRIASLFPSRAELTRFVDRCERLGKHLWIRDVLGSGRCFVNHRIRAEITV